MFITEIAWIQWILLNTVMPLPFQYWTKSSRRFTQWVKTQLYPYIILSILVKIYIAIS